MPKYEGKTFLLPEYLQSGWKAEGIERKKKVGENNGQLRFVYHHGPIWITDSLAKLHIAYFWTKYIFWKCS